MKYRDLINFEPITNVIQLKDAEKPKVAQNLVKSFVASDSMESCFTGLIFPHLQFERFNDNKALMIVGNYGTGKSHMMSVISAIAEDADNVGYLASNAIKDAAASVAGKFKVIRVEAGAAQNSLDNIILKNDVQKSLSAWGVDYTFPDFATISNYKDCINEMMAAFSAKYPDKGILIVIDELLEYLKAKNNQDLYRDLGFFRQLAESCKDTRLRVIVGMQESVFDSPYFMFAGEVLNKIKDRTQLVTIKKNDIKYVVAERLLKKTASQKAQIREYLEKFKPYYPNLTSSFDDFVNLFPLHPAYIDAFSRMVRVEKREVLKSVSKELSSILDKEIPENNLELITIDKYWETVANDAALNTFDGIKEVKDCNIQLQNKVSQLKLKSYIPMARKIIDALSVQRLENTDVSIPIGLTARELKDNLCLYNEQVKDFGDSEEDLLTIIETTLSSIMKVVNGQFIEKTPEDQYFINIHKTYDYDEAISAKIEQLTTDDLNNSYYSILKLVLDCPESGAYMSNKIWDHELQFQGHKMYRKGWLFFGTPNERPTAVPEKDFYLFLIPPFNTPRYNDTDKSDELVFRLQNIDQEFDSALRSFAATTILATSSPNGIYKNTFLNKAESSQRLLSNWLRNNFNDHFTITFENKTKTISNWITGVSLRDITGIAGSETLGFKEKFNAISSYILTPNFEAVAPEYPKFAIKLTESNLNNALTEALRFIANNTTNPTNTQAAVLNGLGLMQNGKLKISASKYANWVVEQVNLKPDGVVLRQDEIICSPHDQFYCTKKYRLEKPLLSVVLMALVHSGDIVLTVRGKKYDASNIRDLLPEGVNGIADFSSISKPVDWNPAVIKAMLKLFNQAEGLFNQIKNGDDEVVQAIQTENTKIVNSLAEDAYTFNNGLILFDTKIDTSSIGITDVKSFIDTLKSEFESLKSYNNCGRLKNMRKTQSELVDMKDRLDKEREIVAFADKLDKLNSNYSWFETAKTILPSGNQWISKYNDLKAEAIQKAQSLRQDTLSAVQQKFDSLKAEYIRIYSAMHAKARLSGASSTQYSSLLRSDLVAKLTKLSRISILSKASFDAIHHQLVDNIKECGSLNEDELKQTPICPHCSYSPAQQGEKDASSMLQQIKDKLEALLDTWVNSIVDNLQDPSTQSSIKLMSAPEQAAINELISTKALPTDLTDEYIKMLDEALKGLVKKPVKKDTLYKKLVGEGKPITVKELKENFDRFLKEISSGEDEESIRIILE